ncbi:MAG: hypothetical protein ABJA37_09990 [Ferruginibacter sp.]
MIQHTISRIAIWLLGIVMIIFGIHHFRHPENMVIYVPQYIPGGIIWVYFVGVAFILAGLAFILNRFVSMVGYLLALLLFIFVLTIHLPNYRFSGDKEMRQLAFVNLLKDLALGAFAMYVAANARHQRLNEE